MKPEGGQVRRVFAIGFLGEYMTFTTFKCETHLLFEDRFWLLDLTNIFGNLFLGWMAVRVGILLAKEW